MYPLFARPYFRFIVCFLILIQDLKVSLKRASLGELSRFSVLKSYWKCCVTSVAGSRPDADLDDSGPWPRLSYPNVSLESGK